MKKILSILFAILFSSNVFSQDTAVFIIKKGDNLYKISKLYNLSVEDLLIQNNLKTIKVFINQEILIYTKIKSSDEKLALNTNNYNKDIYKRKIADNNYFLKNELLKIQKSKDTLNIEKDIDEFFLLSKKKEFLKDSITNINNDFFNKINKLESDNLVLKDKIELSNIEFKKKKKNDDIENESKTVLVKEAKKEEITANKEKKQKVKTFDEKPKTNQVNIKNKPKLSNDLKRTTLKNKRKKKQDKIVKPKKQTKKKVKTIDKKEDLIQKKDQQKKSPKKEGNTKKAKKTKTIIKNKNEPLKDNLNIELQKDSLFKLLAKNTTYLKKELALIKEKKKTLDIVDDELVFLNLSKRKKLLGDSISIENKHIYKELKRLEKLPNSKDHKISKVKTNAKKERKVAKKSKKVKKNKEILVFDSETKKEKNIKNDIAPNVSKKVEVGKVVINNKKKKKYSFGDVVDRSNKEKAKFYLERARKEIDKNKLKKAKEFIDKSIKLNPSYKDAYVLKGDLYASFTYFDKALKQYHKASVLNPNDAQLYYNMGNCFIKLGSEKNAIIEWSKAIKEDSEYILAYVGRASLFLKDKKYNDAIADYNRIFFINKYFYPAYKSRGVAYLELGDYQKAIKDFNNFLEFEPNDSFVIFKRGMAKLSDNEIYNGCVDLLTASEMGYKLAEKALRKHCEK